MEDPSRDTSLPSRGSKKAFLHCMKFDASCCCPHVEQRSGDTHRLSHVDDDILSHSMPAAVRACQCTSVLHLLVRTNYASE